MDSSDSIPDWNEKNCFKHNYFDKFFKFIGERTEEILRRYKVKITDQSEVLFFKKSGDSKQKLTTRCIKVGNEPLSPVQWGKEFQRINFFSSPFSGAGFLIKKKKVFPVPLGDNGYCQPQDNLCRTFGSLTLYTPNI